MTMKGFYDREEVAKELAGYIAMMGKYLAPEGLAKDLLDIMEIKYKLPLTNKPNYLALWREDWLEISNEGISESK